MDPIHNSQQYTITDNEHGSGIWKGEAGTCPLASTNYDWYILSTLLLTLVSVTVYLLKKDTLDYNIIDTVWASTILV